MTKLQWLFAFLEHSQVRVGRGKGAGGEEVLVTRRTMMLRVAARCCLIICH